MLLLRYLIFETNKKLGVGGLCDYRVSSLALVKSLTIDKIVTEVAEVFVNQQLFFYCS